MRDPLAKVSSSRVQLAALLLLAPFLVGHGVEPSTPAGYDEEIVAHDLTSPTAVAVLPDGRVVVTQKSGEVILCQNGTQKTMTTIPVANCAIQEVGLLGIAVDPEFATNGFLYLTRVKAAGADWCDATNRVTEVLRVTMSVNSIDLDSLTVLLTGIRTDFGVHVGGVVRVGPDGNLYIGTGDAGAGESSPEPGAAKNPYAQDLGSLEGKILRIARDGTIPADNPFVGIDGARPEIFALGFRNVWRSGFDPVGGKFWAIDVGNSTMEEINRIQPGGNYSWPHAEGTLPEGGILPGEIAPAFTYMHGHGVGSYGSAITCIGIAPEVYGPLGGQLFFGDLIGNTIYRAPLDATRDGIAETPVPFVTGAQGPVDIVFGPVSAGSAQVAMYYVAINAGEVRRVSGPIAFKDKAVLGTSLALRNKANDNIKVLSLDAIDAGGPDANPLVFGAELRVTGAGLDTVVQLPANRWSPVGPKNKPPTGFVYKDPKNLAGPIRSARITIGQRLHLVGAGAPLEFELATDPGPVTVELAIGVRRYRLEFGGVVQFTPGKSYIAKKADAPDER
jgi:glucose/arabinose dehydrogenase